MTNCFSVWVPYLYKKTITMSFEAKYGTMEGAPVEQFPLRSFEEYDMPFIEAIENY